MIEDIELNEIKKAQRILQKDCGPRDPWLAIIIAASRGKGLRLSEDEVFKLSTDQSVYECAHRHAYQMLEGIEGLDSADRKKFLRSIYG